MNLRSAAKDLLKDVFENESNLTADKINGQLIQMKAKYEETSKWLQLQKQSQETDKSKLVL